MFKRPGFILAVIIFAASIAGAQPLALSAAVSEALRRNPEIVSARAEWDSAKARVLRSLSLDDPRLGLEYEQIPSGSRNLEDGMKMYSAEQMIMFPGKITAEYLMAEREAEMLSARYKAKVLEISSQVKSAYYELFLADRSIETLREVRDLLSRVKKIAEAKYAVGEVIQVDALQAGIEYLLMDNELLTMQQMRSAKEARLKALLDQRDGSPIEVESTLSLPATLETAADLEEKSLSDRPEILSMKAELEKKDYSHLKSKMEFFPDAAVGVKKRMGDGWDVMLSFSVPLYFWKQGYGLASAGLEREAAEAAYRNMKNMTVWEVKEAWVMADSARRTVKLYEDKIVPQSAQALKAALSAYPSGKIDFQTLLNIERGYKEAKLKLYQSQATYGKALAELERIIGKPLDKLGVKEVM